MAKSSHSKSFSDFKASKHKNALSLVPSFDKTQLGLIYNSQVFRVPKCSKRLVPTEPRVYKKIKESSLKKPKKDAWTLTDQPNEKNKHLAAVETALKKSENKTSEEKFKIALDLLLEIPKIDLQFTQLVAFVKEIIEDFAKKLQDKSENAQQELVEDRQSVKILKKRFKKIALENLTLSQSVTEVEEKYEDLKAKHRELRARLKERNALVARFEENREHILKDLNFYIRWGKKLKDVHDFESFVQFKDRFQVEKQDKESDIMNVSSIEINSDAFRDSHHIKSQSSSLILF